MRNYNLAVIGATGAVGRCLLSILEERNFPINEIKLLASERSRDKKITFMGKKLTCEVLSHVAFKNVDLVLSSAGAARSIEFLPSAVKAGAVCIDNTSAFRMREDVPLIVPEINAHAIKDHKGIIANPNCSTIQMVIALNPIHKAAKIKRIVVSTYQSVSGAGQKKIKEFGDQATYISSRDSFTPYGRHNVDRGHINEFPYQIAFNLLPQIDVFEDNGYTKEEMKMVNETKKIFEDDSIRVTATCVRVPVFFAHAESINIETEKKIASDKVRQLLLKAPGVKVLDNLDQKLYPMPLFAEGKDETFVGRIREDESVQNGINMWAVSDNLRKGAALNAVQIAEHLIKQGL